MLMLRETSTGKTSAAYTLDPSSLREGEDDLLPEEEEEAENEEKEITAIRRCRKCQAILREGNDDTICRPCHRAEWDGTAKKFVPRDPNQRF